MQLRRKSRMSSEVSTSSLNDIMFFLMLFFLIVSTLGTSAIKVNVPKSDAGKAVSKTKVILSIDSTLNYYIDKDKLSFDELEPRLSKYVNADTSKQPVVLINADRNITVQNLMDVYSIGIRLKIDMALATTTNK